MSEQNIASTEYGDVEIPGPETGVSSAPVASEPTPGQGQTPQEPWWKQHENSELEFTASGKQVKAPLSKVRQWAQQGFDYGQKMQAYNQQRQELEARAQELAKDGEWAEVVKFARENPEWNQYVRQQWEQRQNWRQQNQNDPTYQELQSLRNEFQPLKQEVEAFRSERQRIQHEQQDKALDSDIQAVKERYSKYGMDLSSIDPETGSSYEQNVLKYGSENGIKSFKTAFLELYGDKIEAMRDEAAKKQAADDFAKRQKEGFIGRTPTPTKAPSKAQNVRNKSWGNLSEEALQDIQSGKY